MKIGDLIFVPREGIWTFEIQKNGWQLNFLNRCAKNARKIKKSSKCELNFKGNVLWGKKGTLV